MGGENTDPDKQVTPETGSSPRGRGKPRRRCPLGNADGLIPAWAGKTICRSRPRRRGRAHPRVGGENYERIGDDASAGGSSPRGRGKPDQDPEPVRDPGLIPAWAGKTTTLLGTEAASRAHPRVGGENAEDRQAALKKMGSSPRGRGKQTCSVSHHGVWGLIPAWAGKTPTRADGERCRRAHPRVGGENGKPFTSH